MASLIRRGCIANESWHLLDATQLATWLARGPQAVPDAIGILIPLPAWRAHAAEVLAAGSLFGIVLEAGDDPADIADELDRIPVVAVRFARFADGRGYSIARLLRTHVAGVLSDGDEVMLEGGSDGGRALLLAARPLAEPVVQYGPFVMNTREEIEQAIRDYQGGRFAKQGIRTLETGA